MSVDDAAAIFVPVKSEIWRVSCGCLLREIMSTLFADTQRSEEFVRTTFSHFTIHMSVSSIMFAANS